METKTKLLHVQSLKLINFVEVKKEESFTNAILDPAYGVLQEVIQRSLNPTYDEARGILSNLESKSAGPLLNYVSWERGLHQKSVRSKHKLSQTCSMLPAKWL